MVDDDTHTLFLMQRILELEGYRALTAANGESALMMINEEVPDLLLLDVMMPRMDGYAVCQKVRELCGMPIIMVTAKDDVKDIAQGLDAGADDYVTKPFSSKILMAKMRAVLRRAQLWGEQREPAFCSGSLQMDFASHRATVAGVEIELTATEYKLLSYLTHNSGRLISPRQILEAVWGDEYIGEDHLLRVNIARLRQKLGDNSKEPRFIVTKVGIGYEFKCL